MQQRSKVIDSTIHFNNLALSPTDSARILGVIFDSNLLFKKHISSVCSSSFFHIRQLRKIRPSLDKHSAIVLANSLVHSKMDYCNSLLHGLPTSSIARLQLQRAQNSLARVVCCSSKFRSHSADLLKNLHWLPVPQRIKFQIAKLTFKVLHFHKPYYLVNRVSYYEPSRNLRSVDSYLLTVHT